MGSLAKYKTITIDCTEEKLKVMHENTLGQRIKKQRVKKNLSIKDLAKLSSMTSHSIVKIEKEETVNPSIENIKILSTVLEVSISYLLDTNNMIEDTVAQIIKKYRLSSGFTQKELALRCNLHPAAISDYENGRCNGTHASETLDKIYKAIGYKI